MDILPRLRLGARLGSGAAGDVFTALLDDSEVAAKVVKGPVRSLDTRKCIRQAWEREKRTALILTRHPHPHLASYKAAFEIPHGSFEDLRNKVHEGDGMLIMEKGVSIETPHGERDPADDGLGPIILATAEKRMAAAKRAARVAVSVACGLAHLHSVVKTIHRDVKPDNLLEINGRVCLSDFSAARTQLYHLQRATTGAGQGIGTMGFFAPEICGTEARYCSKVDIWSLGITTLLFYNAGKPCEGRHFYNFVYKLQSIIATKEQVERSMQELEENISQRLYAMLPDESGVVATLRDFLILCLRANPCNRPSAVSLLRTPEVQILADFASVSINALPKDIELLEDRVEESLVVADLIQELVKRFQSSDSGMLNEEGLNMLRSSFHKALADMDVRSLELITAWLEFLRSCHDVPLFVQDNLKGQTLLHAAVQNHRSEALMDLVEDHCQAGFGELNEESLNIPDADGCTPLALAASCAMSPTVCLRLLDLKSDLNIKDNEGKTPMDHAASKTYNRAGEERDKVITSLIACGAEVPERLKESVDYTPKIREALALTELKAQAIVAEWRTQMEQKIVLARRISLAVEEEEEIKALVKAVDAPVEVEHSISSETKEEASPDLSAVSALVPPVPEDLTRSATHQEDMLKEHLLRRAGNHAGTAFRFAATASSTSGTARVSVSKVSVDQLLHELREVMPGIDETEIRRRFCERWSKGVGYREFEKWLKSPSTSTVAARRHLVGSGLAGRRPSLHKTPVRGETSETSAEHVAGLRGAEAHTARLRAALLKLFTSVDGDCDGIVSEEEFMKAQQIFLESVCEDEFEDGSGNATASKERNLVAYAVADLKKDGILEEDEWLEWTMEHMVPYFKSTKLKIAKRLEHTLLSLDDVAISSLPN